MERKPLLGDEAVALAAIHSGLSGAYSYPGTPATEIFECVERETAGMPPAKDGGVHHVWSANEKVAYEEALGMSYAGRRALVSFKHVGLNVAADPFMNSAVTGVEGGFVVASADDPGMHSSQNEQDSRIYASFALLPCLEPSSGQEAYDMTAEAYELSERFKVPVMLRLVTRLSHSRSGVTVRRERRSPNPLKPTDEVARWTLLPANARRGFKSLVEKQPALRQWSNESRFNQLKLNPKGGRRGVIACGIAVNYLLENFAPGDELPSYLKVGTYPIPSALVARLLEEVDEVLVLEDGYPYLEGELNGLFGNPKGKKVHGRLDGVLPRTGELTPDTVRAALGLPERPRQKLPAVTLASRPPSLCDGCPHIDSYAAIKVMLQEFPEARVFSDIGCYALAAYAPHEAAHSCVDMGASIPMAMGAAQAGMHPVFATIGDSTFAHSGLTGLLGAARQNLNMVVFILDNSTVGMTGQQQTMLSGQPLVEVLKGMGVHPEHIHVVNPHRKHHAQNVELIRREVGWPGLSVIIPVRECIQIK